MRCGKSCCVPDHVNRTFKVLKNIRIPKSDNAITEFLEFNSSLLITEMFLRFIVLTAIKFDNQFAIVACEVRDVCPNRNLAAKVTLLIFELPELLP